MTDQIHATGTAGQEALDALLLMLRDDEITDAARVSAAKALLDRFLPKEDAELKRREAEERADAIAEAKCILAELAAAQSAGVSLSPALAEDGAPQSDNAGSDHADAN